MRVFFRIIGVLLLSVALSATILAQCVSTTLMENKYVEEHLASSGIYDSIMDTITETVAAVIPVELGIEDPEEVARALVNTLISEEALQKEVEAVIDQVYAEGDDIEITGKYLAEDLSRKLAEFVESIGMESHQQKYTETLLSLIEMGLEQVDLEETTNTVLKSFQQIRQTVDIARYGGGALSAALVVLFIIFSKEKLRSLAVAVFLSGAIILVAVIIGGDYLVELRFEEVSLFKSLMKLLQDVWDEIAGTLKKIGFYEMAVSTLVFVLVSAIKAIIQKRKEAY